MGMNACGVKVKGKKWQQTTKDEAVKVQSGDSVSLLLTPEKERIGAIKFKYGTK